MKNWARFPRKEITGILIEKGAQKEYGDKFIQLKGPLAAGAIGSYRKKMYGMRVAVRQDDGTVLHSLHWGTAFHNIMLGDTISFTANVNRGLVDLACVFYNPRKVDVISRMYDELQELHDSPLKTKLLRVHKVWFRSKKFTADRPHIALKMITNEKNN